MNIYLHIQCISIFSTLPAINPICVCIIFICVLKEKCVLSFILKKKFRCRNQIGLHDPMLPSCGRGLVLHVNKRGMTTIR